MVGDALGCSMVIRVGWIYHNTNAIHQELQCNRDTELLVEHWTDTLCLVYYRACFASRHLISLWTANTPPLRSAPRPAHNHNLISTQFSMLDHNLDCHRYYRRVARKEDMSCCVVMRAAVSILSSFLVRRRVVLCDQAKLDIYVIKIIVEMSVHIVKTYGDNKYVVIDHSIAIVRYFEVLGATYHTLGFHAAVVYPSSG